MWFSQSELASKYSKIWRTTLKTFSRMVGKYGPSAFYLLAILHANMLNEEVKYFDLTKPCLGDSVVSVSDS